VHSSGDGLTFLVYIVFCGIVMALSVCFWANYTRHKPKLSRKSENAVSSDRVLKIVFDEESCTVNAVVQASMRDTSYKVQVSNFVLLNNYHIFKCYVLSVCIQLMTFNVLIHKFCLL
jgi:hypothetical protein